MNNEKNKLKYYVIIDQNNNSHLDIKEFNNFYKALDATVLATNDDKDWALLLYDGDNFIWFVTSQNNYSKSWSLPIAIIVIIAIIILIIFLS